MKNDRRHTQGKKALKNQFALPGRISSVSDGLSILYSIFILLYSVSIHAQDLDSTKVKKVVLYDGELTGHRQSGLWNPLQTIGYRHGGFEIIRARSPTELDTVDLDGMQIILFYSDGDVLPDSVQRAWVEDFVRVQGGGLILMHASADSTDWPFLREAAVQWRLSSIGGTEGTIYSDTAGLNSDETRKILEGLPERWQSGSSEEWYTFKESARLTPGVTVLLSIDESTYPVIDPMGDDHPIAWTRKMGNGVAVYNSMGHSGISILDDNSLQLLWGMMRYAAKDFVGCMDSNYVEYNPEATVTVLTPSDPRNPCVTPINVSIGLKNRFADLDVSTNSQTLILNLRRTDVYRVIVVTLQGKTVYKRDIQGPDSIEIPGLKRGIHVVRIRSERGTETQRVYVR